MADIKTRESLQTVKTFDRLQNLGAKTRKGFDEAKEDVQEVTSATGENESEYAGSKLQNAEHGMIRSTVYGADKVGRWGVKQTARNIRKWKQRRQMRDIKVDMPKQNTLPAPKQPRLLEAPKKAGQTAKSTAKTVKGTAKTAKAGVKTSAKTVKTTDKTAKATAKASAKAAQAEAKAAKAAVQATIKFVKVAVKAIVTTTKAVIAAVKGIIAAIAAGDWVAVVVILILCIIGGVVAWVSSIFGSGDDGGYSTSYMFSVCQNEYKTKEINLIEQTPHDYLSVEGNSPDEREVIAVFAVLSDLDVRDLQSVDEQKQSDFRTVFETMNRLESYCSTSEETVMRQYTDKDGKTYEKVETITKTTLHIVRHTMGATEAGECFKFDKRQSELLQTLLSDELDGIWLTEQTDP